jgi:hypothetical protein
VKVVPTSALLSHLLAHSLRLQNQGFTDDAAAGFVVLPSNLVGGPEGAHEKDSDNTDYTPRRLSSQWSILMVSFDYNSRRKLDIACVSLVAGKMKLLPSPLTRM